MLIVKKVKRNDDGSYTQVWDLSEEQMAYLLTYAINSLLREGVISVEEEEDTSDDSQMQLDFLTKVPKEVLGRA